MSDSELTPSLPSEPDPNEATAGVRAFITLRSELSEEDVFNAG